MRSQRRAASPSGWGWRFRPSWGLAATMFGGFACFWLYLAWQETMQKREQLHTWPTVTAHIDSATVVTPEKPREAMYAVRYWLSYQWQGASHRTAATRSVYSSDFPAVHGEMESTKRNRSLQVLLNPKDPNDLVLGAGWNGNFFFSQIIMTVLGLCFLFFAILFHVLGRRAGMGQQAVASFAMPARYGVPFCVTMGCAFLGAVGFTGWTQFDQDHRWWKVQASVDSADVVQASDRNGTTYARRFWLSYSVRDSVYRVPLLPDWSSKRAKEVARAGQLTVSVSPRDPLVIAKPTPIIGILGYTLWSFFAAFSFVMAYVAHRVSQKERRREERSRANR